MNGFRKALLGSSVLLGMAAMAGTAAADVFVFATIDKDKDKTVTETITKDKDVQLDVTVERELSRGAESEALINQRNEQNGVSQSDATLSATMTDSVNDNSGQTQVNSDVGNMVNQANVVAIAAVTDGEDLPKFVDAQASAEQQNNSNNVSSVDSTITASISGSISGNEGVTQVNQNAGNINNQLNGVSLAVGDDPTVVALSEADLGQFNSGQSVNQQGVNKSASIANSINDNSGVTQVNQSAGNLGNQGNLVAISASF